MNLPQLTSLEWPAVALAVVGLVLLFLVFKAGKFFLKLFGLLILLALGGAAYWWYRHQ